MDKRRTRLGRPPKQEARNTRECILNAALELFAAQGFAGTSLRQIARTVGIKESAIYAHFESKEALYRTIFEQFGPPVAIVDEILGDLSTVVQLEPGSVVREIAARIIARWDEPRARLFTCLAQREGKLDAAPGGDFMPSTKEQVRERLVPLFQRWIEQGCVRRDFAPEHLVWELLAPLALIRITYWHVQATEAQRELGHRRADLHIEYFLRTVLTQKTDDSQKQEQ